MSKHIVFTDRVAKILRNRAERLGLSPSKYIGKLLTTFEEETLFRIIRKRLPDFLVNCGVPEIPEDRSLDMATFILAGDPVIAYNMLESDLDE